MIKAILFDFWGTLAENGVYSPLKQTYNILRARMRYSAFVINFERAAMTKKFSNPEELFASACNALRIDYTEKAIKEIISIWNKNSENAKLFPETIEALESLKKKNIKLAIATNSPSFGTEEAIEKLGVKKYFDEIFYSYEVGFLKTVPKMFELAEKKMGVKKDELLMVGDSKETDIYGAEKAGVQAVLVDRNGKRTYVNKAGNLLEVENFLD